MLPTVNNHQLGENSPNQVTLLVTLVVEHTTKHAKVAPHLNSQRQTATAVGHCHWSLSFDVIGC
jgi:hypothetical protein